MKPFDENITKLIKSRYPIIYVHTWEENRLIDTVKEVVEKIRNETVNKTDRKIYLWSSTKGIVETRRKEGNAESEEQIKDTQDILKALMQVERCTNNAIFIFKDMHQYFGYCNRPPDNEVIRKIRDLVPTIQEGTSAFITLIFVSPSLVLPQELQKDVTVLEFPLPTFDEIMEILNGIIEDHKDLPHVHIDLNKTQSEQLVRAAMGLTSSEARRAFMKAIVGDKTLSVKDVDIILEEKQQIIKKSGILEFINSELKIEDVGGLENLKAWLRKRNKSWLEDAKRYGVPAPKGVLITGVPGCGKSLVAKAISTMWQIPLLRLDVGRIFSGIVGSSEENVRNAISTAEAIAPSILWIDEIEKGFSSFGGHNGDSGTSSRVFGTFLTWMQEKTKPVFVIATANNIETLPPEFLRKGRFDEIFFVDLPTNNERQDIFKVHLDKRLLNKDGTPKEPEVMGNFEISQTVLSNLAELTEGFVGAEIEQIVITALFEAFAANRSITYDDLKKSIQDTVPLSITQAERIITIREWANARAVAATRREDLVGYSTESPETKNETKEAATNDVTKKRGGRSLTVDM